MMKSIFPIALSCILIAGCGSNSNKESPQKLVGTQSDGYEFTIVSKNGYHAVRINDQNWSEVSGELELININDEDKIEIIELCKKDGSDYYAHAKSEIHNFDTLKYFINNESRLIKHCYSITEQVENPKEIKYNHFTLYSQQINEGIELYHSSLSTNYRIEYINNKHKYKVIDHDSKNESLSLISTGYNSEKNNYYLYFDNHFTFTDGDEIGLDFYGANSFEVEHENFDSGEYNLHQSYCFSENQSVCFDLTINYPNKIKLTLPENLKDENGYYSESWSINTNDELHFRYSVISKDIENENIIKSNWNTLHNIELLKNENKIWVESFPILGFNNSEWDVTSITHYDDFSLRVSDLTDSESDSYHFHYIDLTSLPNIPSFFNKPLESISLLNMDFNGGIYSHSNKSNIKNQFLYIQVPVPLEYIK